ncbi:unnamed protein product [Polarella glacialis]|uniref:Uncharacterized protein n=1 Tax=Polarella glacialis TaxID=89957 RepID=A0A813KLE1_POLGL|nr:unnamed protein product [Polarella glacialis]
MVLYCATQLQANMFGNICRLSQQVSNLQCVGCVIGNLLPGAPKLIVLFWLPCLVICRLNNLLHWTLTAKSGYTVIHGPRLSFVIWSCPNITMTALHYVRQSMADLCCCSLDVVRISCLLMLRCYVKQCTQFTYLLRSGLNPMLKLKRCMMILTFCTVVHSHAKMVHDARHNFPLRKALLFMSVTRAVATMGSLQLQVMPQSLTHVRGVWLFLLVKLWPDITSHELSPPIFAVVGLATTRLKFKILRAWYALFAHGNVLIYMNCWHASQHMWTAQQFNTCNCNLTFPIPSLAGEQ